MAAAPRCEAPSGGPGALVTRIDEREIEVSFELSVDLDRVWYLSEGRLRRLRSRAP